MENKDTTRERAALELQIIELEGRLKALGGRVSSRVPVTAAQAHALSGLFKKFGDRATTIVGTDGEEEIVGCGLVITRDGEIL